LIVPRTSNAAPSSERTVSTRALATVAPLTAPPTPASTEAETTVPESTSRVETAVTATVPTRTIAALSVRARRETAGIVVNWKRFADRPFRRYVIFRVESWDGSSVPTSGRLTGIAARGMTRFVDR